MYKRKPKLPNTLDMVLVLRFIATSFIYLFIGLVFLFIQILGVLNLRRDAIFVLWLFGFASMIVFGLSYMFVSGLLRNKAFMNSTMKYEYILINIGLIIFFTGFSGIIRQSFAIYLAGLGIITMMVAILMHIINILLAMKANKKHAEEETSFKDDF
ncbi:MAG: hypothetical protein ACYDAO_07060 [Thermoplasmataceae archaeon]